MINELVASSCHICLGDAAWQEKCVRSYKCTYADRRCLPDQGGEHWPNGVWLLVGEESFYTQSSRSLSPTYPARLAVRSEENAPVDLSCVDVQATELQNTSPVTSRFVASADLRR